MNDGMFMSQHGGRPEAIKIAVVISGGESQQSSHLTIAEAIKAKGHNIYILVVGIGRKVCQIFN